MALGLPRNISCSLSFAITPCPGIELNAVTERDDMFFSDDLLTIAFAIGCCDLTSTEMPFVRHNFHCNHHFGIISVTSGLPLVSVPVLSNTIVSIDANFSKYFPPFIKMPSLAALPMPNDTTIGVAIPKAQGQETTRIVAKTVITN